MQIKDSLSIKDWNIDDRPREKLVSKGVNSLSNAELLAILIGSGNREESAVGLSKRILSSVNNNYNTLAKLSIEQLMQFKGVGAAKAVSIITALELGRRRASQNIPKLDLVNSSKSVFNVMYPLLGDLQHEEFWVLFLNNSNKVLSKQQFSRGGVTGTMVDIRLIFKKALELLATSIILVHNHPSGNLSVSKEDESLTDKIVSAAQLIDIKVLDHIIIAQHNYTSFTDLGKL